MPNTALNPEKVLSDLTRAWQGHASVGSETGVVRAAMLNLVIFTPSPKIAALIEEALPQVVAEHPCRCVHITALPGAAQDLRAWTKLHTRMVDDSRQISCEQVTIEGGIETLNQLEGVIAPLLSPDLPVYLWWRGDPPFEGLSFEKLVAASDNMLFDSADFDDPQDDFNWLHRLIREEGFDVTYSDLNWSRLVSWRTLLAQFFDVSKRVPYLAQLRSVEIQWDKKASPKGRVVCQAWLLLGWLASRLGWEPLAPTPEVSGDETRVKLRSQQGQVEAVLRGVDSQTSSRGGVVAVDLRTENALFRVAYTVSNYAHSVMELPGTPPVERVVPMEEASEILLIGREFSSGGRDVIYEDSLKACIGLLG